MPFTLPAFFDMPLPPCAIISLPLLPFRYYADYYAHCCRCRLMLLKVAAAVLRRAIFFHYAAAADIMPLRRC